MLSQDDLNAIANAQAQYPVLGQDGISLLGIANLESASQSDPDTAVSPTGAIGLFQILASTATSPGYGVTPIPTSELTNPTDNADFAAAYLTGLINSGDTPAQAIQTYSGGGYTLAQVQSAASSNPLTGSLSGVSGQSLSIGTGSTGGFGSAYSTAANSGGLAGVASGAYAWIVELFDRGGVVIIGIALVILGLIFMFIDAKTVSVPLSKLGAFRAA